MSGESLSQRARDEMEERLKRAKKFAVDNGWADESDPVVGDLVAFAESESSLSRKQEREECAKAWCEVCRDENYAKPEFFQRKEYEQSMWWHRRTKNHHDNLKNIVCCTAAAIHERGRKVEG